MTRDELEVLFSRVSKFSDEAIDEVLQSIQDIGAKYNCVYRLSDEERAAVRRGLLEMKNGQLARDEEVRAVFDRYRTPPD